MRSPGKGGLEEGLDAAGKDSADALDDDVGAEVAHALVAMAMVGAHDFAPR